MNEDTQFQQLLQAVESLRADISRLETRVAQLEGGPGPWRSASAPRSLGAFDGIDPDVVMSIAAAVASYLGVKPRIRQIRLLDSGAWAQQGRVMIQASYAVSNPNR